ncbi:hypothetical protein ACTQVS_00835 [Anaerovoracaceae bacterium HCP3S3_H6]
MKSIIYVGMDVHKGSFTLSCFSVITQETFATVKISPDAKAIKKYLDGVSLSRSEECEFVCGYAARCLGYTLYHQLTAMNIRCVIMAPTTILRNSEYNSKSGTLGTVEIKKCDISTDGALEPIYDKEFSLLSATQTVQLRIEGIRCFKTSTRLNEGEDYVLEGDTGEISKPGTYSFTVRGTGSKYTGEAKFSFNVVKKYTDPSEGGGNTEKPEPSKPEPSEPPKPETKTQITDVYLSASKYTYNGKVHTPRVEVYGEDDDEVPTDQYKVTYSSGRKNLGSYTVTVTGINDYEGTIKKTYVITPAKMKTPSVKAGKKKLTVKWKKLGGGSQTYQIYVLKKGTKKAKYYTSTGSSKTIKKLSKKKYYYTKIRSYKKINGKTYYGSWSGTKKVKVK